MFEKMIFLKEEIFMEIWDEYDRDRIKTGKTIERGQYPQNSYRTVVHICIFNSEGKMLIQQRDANKIKNPNKWDITLGGCVQAGETSRQAAERELKEELDITYDFSNKNAHLTINFDFGFDDFFLIEKDVEIKAVKFVDNEVQKVKWASEKEILQMIVNGEFINYFPTLISALFEMRKNKGVFKN